VTHASVNLDLEQRRPVSVAGAADSLPGGLVDRDGVVDVDASAREVEPASALCTVLDVGDALFAC